MLKPIQLGRDFAPVLPDFYGTIAIFWTLYEIWAMDRRKALAGMHKI